MSASDDLNMRTLILQKSTELFLSEGYDNTTIRQIADASNVGRGHLYYYFKKKEDILLYLFTNLLKNIQKLVTDLLGNESDFHYKISLTACVYIHILTQNKDIFRIYIEASRVSLLRREYIQIMDKFIEEISASSNYELDSQELHLNSVVSVSGEFELLSHFNDDVNTLSLEMIISTIIKTRLLLFKVPYSAVEELIEVTLKEYERLKKLDTFDYMSEFLVKVN